jgi:uncharacterized protein YukE
MKRAADELGQILNYEKLSAIRFLEQPNIEKQDIPNFIFCPKFEKAMAKVDQTMERYQGKVDRIVEEIHQIEQGIAAMEKEQRKWSGKASTFMLDRSDAGAVEKQNNAAENANRLLDQISRANEKRNDLIDKHNAAVEEAKEKLQELTHEAHAVIDEDIVTVLDKCTKIVDRLSGSQNSEDLVAAIEICLMELRIFALFDDKIEGNAARKDCRDRISDVNRLFAGLCANEHVRNYISDLFRRNAHLIQKNGEIYAQIVEVLGSVDQRQFAALMQSVVAVLGEKFDTNFEYEGVVDPAELEGMVVKIKSTIVALNRGIAKANDVAAISAPANQAAVSAHQNAETLLASMKTNAEDMRNDILSGNHFACQMIEEAVIDDFYERGIRPAVEALRQHLVGAIGEEQVDELVIANEDRYALVKAQNAINQANLVRLQVERDKIDMHIKTLSGLIGTAEEDIRQAGDVPQRNADALSAELGTKYILSCIPGIGFLFALGILGRLKAFELAFRSSNQIYRDLGSCLLAKNTKMTTVVMVVGGLFGVGGMAAAFALKLSPNTAVNAGVPGGILALYAVTIALLFAAGKRLRSYLGISAAVVPEAIPAGGGTNPRS